MAHKLQTVLAGLLCLICLPIPLSASAEIYKEECIYTAEDSDTIAFNVTIEADTFSYTGRYDNYIPYNDCDYYGRLETELTNANCIVVGVTYDKDTAEPTGYRINGLTPGSFGFMTGMSARDVNACLDGKQLQVGDLLYIDQSTVGVADMWPASLDFYPTTVMEYVGNGFDIFGEDFSKILRYELYIKPIGSIDAYAELAVDKGKVNGDDEVDLMDVVSVNKHLLSGYDIGFYGQIAADVDNDGRVTPTDSLNILKKVVGVLDSFEEIQ